MTIRPPSIDSHDPSIPPLPDDAAGFAELTESWRSELDAGWVDALEPVAPALEGALRACADDVRAGHVVLPGPAVVLRAFQQPFDAVRVLVVGQDPYPTPGHAVGLAFSVGGHVSPLPRSLQNIVAELRTDVGVPAPASGDLSAWTEQGVLLLNRVLSVRSGEPGAHRGLGWEDVTAQAIAALAARPKPLVAVLWGNDARKLSGALAGHPVIESAHPSPLSARRGFLGSAPFSQVNTALAALGEPPVDWRLPAAPGSEWSL